jgi:hypothetical protein
MITFLSGFQVPFFTWVSTGLTSFLTLLPLQMFLLLSLVHQRHLPVLHLHYKEEKSDFSSLLVVYTGYRHSLLLRFTMKCFYPSSAGHHLLHVQCITCIKSNLGTALARENATENNSTHWHRQETTALQPSVFLIELRQSRSIHD